MLRAPQHVYVLCVCCRHSALFTACALPAEGTCVQHAQSAVLVVPQLAALASWGWLSRRLAVPRPLALRPSCSVPNGRWQCVNEFWTVRLIARLSTARLVAIDPAQATDWRDKGAQVVRDTKLPHGGHA